MTLQEYKKKKMQDPEFAKAYQEIQHEMQAVRPSLKQERKKISCKKSSPKNRN